MANENLRSRHAFGSLESLDAAIDQKKVDAFDILFLTDKDGHRIGWIDKNGNKVILDMGLSETEVNSKLEEAIAEANAYADEKVETAVEEKVSESVETKVTEKVTETITTVLEAYAAEKFEITDAPEGTIVNYGEHEIRIMCPKNAVFTKQNVGAGGDSNSYYVTLKTYFTDDEIMGYREHLGTQVDEEILKDIKTDENGRRYQPSWLAIAKYDEASDTWSYYGASSNEDKFIGWDYRIDKFNADDLMIASDFVRINLSNEDCHFSSTPFYVAKAMDGVVESANAYTDQKIAEIASGYEIVEF